MSAVRGNLSTSLTVVGIANIAGGALGDVKRAPGYFCISGLQPDSDFAYGHTLEEAENLQPDTVCAINYCGPASFYLFPYITLDATLYVTDACSVTGLIGAPTVGSPAFILTASLPDGFTLVETPLPGALCLFGSVFGGAFWLSRRAVSSLSSA
jgi:hypothetical protein